MGHLGDAVCTRRQVVKDRQPHCTVGNDVEGVGRGHPTGGTELEGCRQPNAGFLELLDHRDAAVLAVGKGEVMVSPASRLMASAGLPSLQVNPYQVPPTRQRLRLGHGVGAGIEHGQIVRLARHHGDVWPKAGRKTEFCAAEGFGDFPDYSAPRRVLVMAHTAGCSPAREDKRSVVAPRASGRGINGAGDGAGQPLITRVKFLDRLTTTILQVTLPVIPALTVTVRKSSPKSSPLSAK